MNYCLTKKLLPINVRLSRTEYPRGKVALATLHLAVSYQIPGIGSPYLL